MMLSPAPLRIGLYASTPGDDFRVVDREVARLRVQVESHVPLHRQVETVQFVDICEDGRGKLPPGLLELLQRVEARELDAVLVLTESRIGTEPRRMRDMHERLARAGVPLLTEAVVRTWPVTRGDAAEATP